MQLQRAQKLSAGQLQKQFLNPTLPTLPDTASDVTDMTASSENKTEGGSTFRGYAAPATTLDEVARLRKHLGYRPISSHIVYAYRTTNSRGGIVENFDSDRNWNCGLELLNMMRANNITDTLCLATRTCAPDYVHIGKRRFELMNSLCLQASKNLGEF